MLALIMIPVAVFWAADNQAFLARVSDAPWQYVGITDRQTGPQVDGSQALPLSTEAHSYILFKQMPKGPDLVAQFPSSDGVNAETVSVWLPDEVR